ncbi:MAG: nucleoside deaminase [Bacilli bacterium]
MINNNDDFYYMNEALKEAYKAYRADEVPVGCVIVNNGKIIARAHNKRQKKHNVFGHAEVLAIKKATKKLHSWILDEATIYVTLEPCLMCAGSILQARIKNLFMQLLKKNLELLKVGCKFLIINHYLIIKLKLLVAFLS